MKTYIIKKAQEGFDESYWNCIDVAELDVEPWKEFPCPYKTKVQLLYTNKSIYVHFSTTETVLRAENTKRNSDVSHDSCMEFFLSPNSDDTRYFNIEINPIGTICLFICRGRGNYTSIDFDEKMFNIKSVITKDRWELFYEIPFSFIKEHFGNISKTMRGNFYKCGKKTIKRHYACWNEIYLSEPEFHCPQFFGELQFE